MTREVAIGEAIQPNWVGSTRADRLVLQPFNMGTRNTGADNSLDLFVRPNGGPAHEFSNGMPLDGTWRHLAITANDALDEYLLYVDGVLDRDDFTYRSLAATAIDTTSIGGILRGDPTGASHWVTALIDDVALWKKALAPESIASLASGTPPDGLGGPGFAITEIARLANGDISITFNSIPGRSYTVFTSTNLDDDPEGSDPRNWADITDDLESQGATTTFIDTAPPSGDSFYVIQENP